MIETQREPMNWRRAIIAENEELFDYNEKRREGDNFKSNGTLLLVCGERDLDVPEFRRVL